MMKSRKEDIKHKISQHWPNVQLNSSEHGTSVRVAVEQAIKQYVDVVTGIILEDLYTTEEFEEDLGLNKPK